MHGKKTILKDVYKRQPEGCDYDLTLYDEYGNQVGKAEWDGEGRKTLTIPNWDTNTNKYCIKIENKNGEEVSPHDYYKISFKVTENKEQEKEAVKRAQARRKAVQNEYLNSQLVAAAYEKSSIILPDNPVIL